MPAKSNIAIIAQPSPEGKPLDAFRNSPALRLALMDVIKQGAQDAILQGDEDAIALDEGLDRYVATNRRMRRRLKQEFGFTVDKTYTKHQRLNAPLTFSSVPVQLVQTSGSCSADVAQVKQKGPDFAVFIYDQFPPGEEYRTGLFVDAARPVQRAALHCVIVRAFKRMKDGRYRVRGWLIAPTELTSDRTLVYFDDCLPLGTEYIEADGSGEHRDENAKRSSSPSEQEDAIKPSFDIEERRD